MKHRERLVGCNGCSPKRSSRDPSEVKSTFQGPTQCEHKWIPSLRCLAYHRWFGRWIKGEAPGPQSPPTLGDQVVLDVHTLVSSQVMVNCRFLWSPQYCCPNPSIWHLYILISPLRKPDSCLLRIWAKLGILCIHIYLYIHILYICMTIQSIFDQDFHHEIWMILIHTI